VTNVRAVGIDLGSKALHVVVIEARPDLTVVDAAVVLADSNDEIRQLCEDADAIAIDAPSEPSTALHARDDALSTKFRVARCGEIALGEQHRCWVPWVTPQSAEAARRGCRPASPCGGQRVSRPHAVECTQAGVPVAHWSPAGEEDHRAGLASGRGPPPAPRAPVNT
jgi:hypothetical protein